MPGAILDDCYRMDSSWFTQGHPLRGLGSAGVIPGMFCIGKPGELLVCLGLTPPSYGVSLLQGLLSCAFVCLGAHATKLWSVAPPGLNGDDELIRGVSLRSTPSLYYFAHKGLIHRHQSVHSVNSLENRSCSFPFPVNPRSIRICAICGVCGHSFKSLCVLCLTLW